MHKNDVGTLCFENALQLIKHGACNIKQGLILLHYCKIVIQLDIKDGQYLFQHFAMLSSTHHDRSKLPRPRFQLIDKRTHLNCFWSRAKYQHHFFHIFCQSSSGHINYETVYRV